jgi:hypothetical protein
VSPYDLAALESALGMHDVGLRHLREADTPHADGRGHPRPSVRRAEERPDCEQLIGGLRALR